MYKKYPIGTKFVWKNPNLAPQYDIVIDGYSTYNNQKYIIKWTAKETNVEGHAKGESWTTEWFESAITQDLCVVPLLPEDLFTV